MTDKCKLIYESARKNEQFLKEIWEADGDKKPSRIFASNVEIHFFVSVYYGWLVGKYGNNWEENI